MAGVVNEMLEEVLRVLMREGARAGGFTQELDEGARGRYGQGAEGEGQMGRDAVKVHMVTTDLGLTTVSSHVDKGSVKVGGDMCSLVDLPSGLSDGKE
jgi:hypothetical protein